MILQIDNSESKVLEVPLEHFKALRDLLSYEVPPVPGRISFNTKRSLLSKRGDFPTGLLYLVEDYILQNRLECTTIDNRHMPHQRLKMPYKRRSTLTPYPEQLEAAEACHRAKRGIVVAPTGTGKSLIIALIIERLQLKTLVVVPSLEIKRQLAEFLSTTFSPQKVGGFSDSKDIIVENIDSLDPNESLDGYDCVIIDEFHHSGAQSYRNLNKKLLKNTYFRFGLTATPFRSQDHERLLLESVLSNKIYEIYYQTAVHKGYIVPLEAYYVEVPKTKCTKTTWAGVYSELIVNKEIRNEIITKILLNLTKAKKSTLCLVKEVKHGEILSNDGAFPLVTGVNDERHLVEKFNKGQISTLVSTTGIMGEGVDSKPCEYVIIAGLGKSKNAFMQQVGRTFRKYLDKESGKVILFLDRSHKFTVRHFKHQKQFLLDEYGIEPVKLELKER